MSRDTGWSQFALLLIDVQQGFWPESISRVFPDFPANVETLLQVCRSEGIEIVHVQSSFRKDMSDWMLRYRLRGSIPCIAGTPSAELLDCAVPLPGERVFEKQTFDAFLNPDVERYLGARGKRFVLTAGLVTSTCVLMSTMAAAQRGFLATLVEDASADLPGRHESTLAGYRFAFETVAVAEIVERRDVWLAQLERVG